jgi:hypothetical protein
MKIAIVHTGCAAAFNCNVSSQISIMYPQAEITKTLVTWKGMNGPGVREAFADARIIEHDQAQYAEEIARAASAFPLKMRETVPKNSISMFYSWKLTRDALQEIEADLYVKCRLDNKIMPLGPDHAFLDRSGLFIPAGGDWRGGMSDQFCSGAWEDVSYYLGIFERLPLYAAAGVPCHPETLLRFHLIDAGQRHVERARMVVAYHRGIYNPDAGGAFEGVDAQKCAPQFSFSDLVPNR